jgi:hypothetical protein
MWNLLCDHSASAFDFSVPHGTVVKIKVGCKQEKHLIHFMVIAHQKLDIFS